MMPSNRVIDSAAAGMASPNERSSRPAEGATQAWSFSAIRWGRVFKVQDYINLLLTIGFVVGLIIADNAQNTTVRPFWIYDATISFPHKGASTVPYWVAIVVPLALMVLSFVVGELFLARRWHAIITSAVASLLFFVIDGISAFVVTGFVTQITKVGVGRYRPDWLARCNPGGVGSDVLVEYGSTTSDNPVCNPAVTEGEIKDGHWSFPSGHTSTVFVFAVYGAVYCTWAFYFRVKQQPPGVGPSAPCAGSTSSTWAAGTGAVDGAKAGPNSMGRRCLRDLWSTLAFVWIFIQMGFAWGVGVSRIVDNKHHPSDVVAGAFLGTGVGLLYVLRAIPRHRRMDDLDDCGAEWANGTPLLAVQNSRGQHSEMV